MTIPTYECDKVNNKLTYENGQRIAKIDPDHFKHLVAEMAEHVRWQEMNKEKGNVGKE